MKRIRMPAIREINGDSEMPTKVDIARTIGHSPRWTVSSPSYPNRRGDARPDIVNRGVSISLGWIPATTWQ
jgi:hypothetical protein